MFNKEYLQEKTEYLLNCNFFDDNFDPEGREDHLACAEELFCSYPFTEIFSEWNNYLRKKCLTAKDVINCCNLLSYYGIQDYPIPDAYDFVGYIYFMVDINKYWDIAGDFLDGFCTSILEKAGEVSLMNDPSYQSWNDPKVIAVISKYQRANK